MNICKFILAIKGKSYTFDNIAMTIFCSPNDGINRMKKETTGENINLQHM
jgi:hypothetical protein